jgi:site-specific DNA recombinase
MATRRAAPQGSAKRAVGYVRVSTDEQALGPAAQRAALARWCAAHGAELVATHEDIGASGAAGLERRPGLALALGALGELGAGVLLVAKRDRLARDVVLAAYCEATAAKHGARVVSCAGEGEGDEPAAVLMRTLVDAFAQYERALIVARTKAALAVKKGRGERTGQAPYGRRVGADGRTLEPDPAEQAVIATVRQLRAAGATYRAIVARLEREGVRSRRGRPLTLDAVHAMAR